VPGPTDGSEAIRLEFPGSTRYLRLARLVGAGIAADAGFSVDAIEELRIAVDEACAILVDGTPKGGLLSLRFRVDGDAVVIEGRAPCEDGEVKSDIHPIAAELLRATTTEFSFGDPDESTRTFRLVKRDGRDAS
jgi:serine/threonine-protein kinase RsbW